MQRHAAVKADKTNFRVAMTTLFPLSENQVDAFWATLRTEATVEELNDVVRPLHSLARRVHQARAQGRRWRS